MSTRKRPLALILILMISSTLFMIPSLVDRAAKGNPPPPGDNLKFTVYPDRSVGVEESVYESVNYTKNINITHTIEIYESSNGTVDQDSLSLTHLYMGNGASVVWRSPSPNIYNHTVSVIGPVNFTLPLAHCYGGLPSCSSDFVTDTVQLNIAGIYTFQSDATSDPFPHIPSSPGTINVIAGEENEPAATKFDVRLEKKSSEVLMTEDFNMTLTTFQKASLPFPFNNTMSFIVNGSSWNTEKHEGVLTLQMLSGVSSPIGDLVLLYTVNSTHTVLVDDLSITFNPAFGVPFNNSTMFEAFLDATLQNATWINDNIAVPLNSTSGGKLQLSEFNVTATYNDSASALLTFKIGVAGDLVRFLFLGPAPDPSLEQIYEDTYKLFTRIDYIATYTEASGQIVAMLIGHLVVDLDNKFNMIKTQWLNYTLGNSTATPEWLFLNQTTVIISSIRLQLVSTPSYTWTQFTGLIIKPPTENTPNGFKIPGLFNTSGYLSEPVNFTLVGGANGTNIVHLNTAGASPTPNSTTATTAVWLNLQNFTGLAPIEFTIQVQLATAPLGLTASPGNATVTLTWNAPAGSVVSSYKVYRSTSPGGETFLASATATSHTDTGLSNGRRYYYKVSAVNIAGEGPLSVEVFATPSGPLVVFTEESGGRTFTGMTNSTISNFQYDPSTGIISFQVSGDYGTGALSITIPKSLVPDVSNLQVRIDGTLVTPTRTEDTNNYYLYVTYQHSTKTITINLGLVTQAPAPPEIPWLWIAALILLIIAAGGYYYMRRRTAGLKTPAPVRPS